MSSTRQLALTRTASGNHPATERVEIVFIDAGVADHQTLVDGVRPGVEVIVLDPAADGLAQMAAWAQGKSGYAAIPALSQGPEAAPPAVD